MTFLIESTIAIVIILHIIFMILEIFLWDTTYGRRIFNLTQEEARLTKTLAANQGLYNGFLAAGLIWSLTNQSYADELKVFFLCCVVIAGIFGGITAKRSILFIQALPGLIPLSLLLIF